MEEKRTEFELDMHSASIPDEGVIRLTGADDVQNLTHDMAMNGLDVDLISGRYIVPAGSILGVFSMNLSKPLRYRILEKDEARRALADRILARYRQEEPEEEPDGGDPDEEDGGTDA